MIHLTRALIRRWLDALLHVDDTPHRTALAFSLGVFFGFSPFLGLHTILAVALAFPLGLNRVAVVLGVYSNLPWIIGPYYTITTMLGAVLLRVSLPDGFKGQLAEVSALSLTDGAFWHGLGGLGSLLRPLLWPYVAGSTVGAVLLAGLAYPAALAFVRKRRQHRASH